MKKFYHCKDTSQDESPNFLSMGRRDTIDIGNAHERGMSARAASVNSLDMMSEAPILPRVMTRDMTRSLSDAATRTQSQKQKLVTETELSSSWLYKTMQASINARFKSPRKSPSMHKSDDLEQSILQDPELKPIPIKSKATKTSCMCNFATMVAISLCTIGFLASVATIIYVEIFASRNITSLHTSEAEIDLSDVVMDSLEIYNLTTHNVEGEEHILNEARTHRFDGDEAILNEAMKASSTNDIQSLSNANKSQGLFSDYITDVGNLKQPELKPHILDTNSKIKFQDAATVIYERKQFTEDVESDFSDRFKGRSFGFESEENSKDNSGKAVESLENNLKLEGDTYAEPDRIIQNDSLLLDNVEGADKKSYDFTLNKKPLKDIEETVSEDEFKFKDVPENIKDKLEENESTDKVFKDGTLPSEKPNSSEIFQPQNTEYEKHPNLDTNDILSGSAGTDHANKSDTYNNSTQIVKDSDTILANLSDFQAVQYEDVFRSPPEVNHLVADDHDVSTLLVTIDDTEVSTESFISNRNGDIDLFHVSSPVPSVEPIKQINDNSISPKKSMDMKVSVADVMKHLQKLDVNNKFLTSRAKPKQKENVPKPKRKTASNKDEEKNRYLQRMRLMLFKYLQ